jgi:hypothetical protein
MQVHIERCRGIYETFFPLKGAVKEISVVKIFQERNEYVDYIGKEWGDTTRGLWVVFKKELAVSPLTNAKSKISRSAILETLYHEGFHQYIFYASNCLTPSAWFNEGHAAFFEGFDFKNRGSYDIEPSDRRLKTFPKGITPESLQSLLNMSYDDFYSPVNVSRNYSTAWALIYFIRKGAPLMKKFNYCRIPDKYYDSFCELGNDEEATKKAWEGIDMKQFVDDFNGFWASKRLFRKSKSLDMDKVLNYLRKSSK